MISHKSIRSLPYAQLIKARITSLLLVVLFIVTSEGVAQTVLTVREAEFRNRWAGPQEDRAVPAQYFENNGGLEEDGAQQVGEPSSEDQEPQGLSESMDSMAENIRRRLRFGPLDFQLGLSTGWEYSSQNSVGGTTDFNNSTI